MTTGAADRDPSTLPPSLAARATGWLRGRRAARSGDRPGAAAGAGHPWVTLALALLIAAVPLAVLVGATLLTKAVQRDTARMEAALAPRRAAEQQHEAARNLLSTAIERPGPAAQLDGLAAVLPADAALVRAERGTDGTLALEVMVSDPDALRAALRRVPSLAGLRDVRQQEAEGRTLVWLRQVAP